MQNIIKTQNNKSEKKNPAISPATIPKLNIKIINATEIIPKSL